MLKASPSGVEPTSPEARQAVRALVLESYDWFKGLVKTRRGLTGEELAVVADGRVFSGRQGVGLKLVDEVGSEREAVAWLVRERGVARDLPVTEYRRRTGLEEFGLPGVLAGAASTAALAKLLDANPAEEALANRVSWLG